MMSSSPSEGATSPKAEAAAAAVAAAAEEEEEVAEEAGASSSSAGRGRRQRRLLLAFSKSHPLQRRCDEEKLIRPSSPVGDRRALQQCLNSIEGCKEPARARAAANALRGVKALAKSVPCYVVSEACGPKPLALSAQPETGMHLSGRIPPAKRDLPRHKTCALVGNGPGLRVEGTGEIVDKHDAVYRFNAYNLGPREGKMQDDSAWFAGAKQTYRMFNKKRSLIPEIWGLKGAANETWLFWHYGSVGARSVRSCRTPTPGES